MSARAPLGTPSRKTGKVDADCTSATMMGDGLSDVMSQAAATSFIHMHTLDAIHTPQSMRNTGCSSGVHAETLAPGAGVAAMVEGSGSGGVRLMPENLSPQPHPLRPQSPQWRCTIRTGAVCTIRTGAVD